MSHLDTGTSGQIAHLAGAGAEIPPSSNPGSGAKPRLFTPDEVMFRPRPSIPRPDLALGFAARLLGDDPGSSVWLMTFGGWFQGGRVVAGWPGIPIGCYF